MIIKDTLDYLITTKANLLAKQYDSLIDWPFGLHRKTGELQVCYRGANWWVQGDWLVWQFDTFAKYWENMEWKY